MPVKPVTLADVYQGTACKFVAASARHVREVPPMAPAQLAAVLTARSLANGRSTICGSGRESGTHLIVEVAEFQPDAGTDTGFIRDKYHLDVGCHTRAEEMQKRLQKKAERGPGMFL